MIVDMGFSHEQAIFAAGRCSSIEAAINILLTSNCIPLASISPPPLPPGEREGGIAGMLIAMGYSLEQAEYAGSRCSSMEAAINILSKNPAMLSTAEIEYTCPVCRTECPVSLMITLSCSPEPHRLCKDCFVGYCHSKISENQVESTDLVCPALVDGKVCGTAITIFELQANIPPELFDKYEMFSTRAFCESERMRSCPKCNDWYIDIQAVLEDERRWKRLKCEKCQHIFCGKCGQRPHKGQKDQNIDCEAFSQWLRDNDKSDEAFSQYMKEKKIFHCPKCKMVGEHQSGCKFLYCRCKANFCALCGIQLKESQHFSHFKDGPGCTGPYGEVCKGTTDTAGVDP